MTDLEREKQIRQDISRRDTSGNTDVSSELLMREEVLSKPDITLSTDVSSELSTRKQLTEQYSLDLQSIPDPIKNLPKSQQEYLARQAQPTEYEAKIQMWNKLVPGIHRHMDKDSNAAEPGFFEGIGWNIQDDGLTSTLRRSIEKLTQAESTADEQRIWADLPRIMQGIPEEFEEHFLSLGNYEYALEEAERIRTRLYRDRMFDNASFTKNMLMGVGGFVGDPANLLLGVRVFKGLSKIEKIGLLLTTKGLTGKLAAQKAAVLGSAAGIEEAIRTLPRLYEDETYKQADYYSNVVLSMALGFGFVPAGLAARYGINTAIPKAIDEIGEAWKRYGIDKQVQTVQIASSRLKEHMSHTEVPLKERIRTVTPSEFVRDARAKADENIRNKLREVNVNDVKEALFKAVKNQDVESTRDAVLTSFDATVNALRKRAKNVELFDTLAEIARKEVIHAWEELQARKAGEEAADAYRQSVKEKATETPGKKKPVNLIKERKEREAALRAARERTKAEQKAQKGKTKKGTEPPKKAPEKPETPETPETPEDLSVGAAQARNKPEYVSTQENSQSASDSIELVRERFRELLEDLKEANIPEDALRSAGDIIEAITDRAHSAIDDISLKRDGRIPRREMNSKETVRVMKKQGLISKTLDGFTSVKLVHMKFKDKIQEAADKTGLKLTNTQMPVGKTATALRAVVSVLSDRVVHRNADIEKVLRDAVKDLEHLTPEERLRRLAIANETWVRQREHITDSVADLNLSIDDTQVLLKELNTALDAVSQQLNMAHAIQKKPWLDIMNIPAEYRMLSNAFDETVDRTELARQFIESKLQRAVKAQYWRLSESFSSRMMRTDVPLIQKLVMDVLEVPAGFGGKLERNTQTAAILTPQLTNQLQYPVLKAYKALIDAHAKANNWSAIKRLAHFRGNAYTHEETLKLNKLLLREINRRQMGREANTEIPDYVRDFVDTLMDGYSKAHDMQNGNVAGIHSGNKIDAYTHQSWDDGVLGELFSGNPRVRDEAIELFAEAYTRAGMDPDKAAVIARAVVNRKTTHLNAAGTNEYRYGQERIDGMMPDIYQLEAVMREDNTPEELIDAVLEYLNKTARGEVPSYALHRLPIDLETTGVINGKTISILDMMNQDVMGVFGRYVREASGRTAISLSTNGRLNSQKAVNDYLDAASKQAQALGVYVNIREFQHVMDQLMNTSNVHGLPIEIRRARDAIALASMGGLGESQLAELGLATNRGTAGILGFSQSLHSLIANVRVERNIKRELKGRNDPLKPMQLTPEQMDSKELLDELTEVSGLYSDMYLYEYSNPQISTFDTYGAVTRALNTLSGGKYRPLLQYAQTRFTGYGSIRSLENNTAMAGLVQDLAKHFDEKGILSLATGKRTKRTPFTSEDRMRDLGIDPSQDGWLADKFRRAEYNEEGHLVSLLMEQWTPMERMRFGVILNRHAAQVVQSGFIGEMSTAITLNPWAPFLLQFRSYPLLAAEKQQARNLKFADKEAATGIFLNTISSATSRIIRAYSLASAMPDNTEEERKKKERFLESKFSYDQFAFDTFTYMGTSGMIPEIMGYSEQFGVMDFNGVTGGGRRESIGDSIPAINFADNYMKAIDSALNVGDMSDQDYRNIQNVMPLGTIKYMNLIWGELRDAASSLRDEVPAT